MTPSPQRRRLDQEIPPSTVEKTPQQRQGLSIKLIKDEAHRFAVEAQHANKSQARLKINEHGTVVRPEDLANHARYYEDLAVRLENGDSQAKAEAIAFLTKKRAESAQSLNSLSRELGQTHEDDVEYARIKETIKQLNEAQTVIKKQGSLPLAEEALGRSISQEQGKLNNTKRGELESLQAKVQESWQIYQASISQLENF